MSRCNRAIFCIGKVSVRLRKERPDTLTVSSPSCQLAAGCHATWPDPARHANAHLFSGHAKLEPSEVLPWRNNAPISRWDRLTPLNRNGCSFQLLRRHTIQSGRRLRDYIRCTRSLELCGTLQGPGKRVTPDYLNIKRWLAHDRRATGGPFRTQWPDVASQPSRLNRSPSKAQLGIRAFRFVNGFASL